MSSLTRQRTQLPEAIDERAQLSIRHLVATSRYRVDSPALACIAAITWLFNVYRPRLSVNLSVGDGVAFFAACQAVDRLQSSDLVHGHIRRDEAGRDRVVAFNADNYGHFSSLFDYADSVAKSRYRNDSIDLVYVEIADFQQFDVTALIDKWTPKMSSGGCIVIQHGCATGVGGGVDAVDLPADLADGALAIHCGENAGLVLLPIGDDQPTPIARLSEAGFSTELDFVFSRLGVLHRNEVLARTYKDQLDRLGDDVTQIDARLQASEARRLEVGEDLAVLRDAYADRSGIVARLQAEAMDRSRAAALLSERQAEQAHRLATTEAELEAARRALVDRRERQDDAASQAENLSRWNAERDEIQAERDRLAQALDEAVARSGERQAQHDGQISMAKADVDRLTKDLADARATASRDLAAKDQHVEALEADLARLRQIIAEVEAKHEADLVQRDGQIAELGSQLAIVEAREESLRAANETLSLQREESRALALAEQEAARTLRLRIARLEGETDVRFKETATLTLRCEQLDQERALAIAEAQDAQVEIRSLMDALDDRDRRLIDGEMALQAALDGRAAVEASRQAMTDRLGLLEAGLVEAAAALNAERADVERLSADRASLQALCRTHEASLVASHNARAELERRLAEAMSDVASGQAAMSDANAQILALEQDRRRLASQVQTMRGTTSWKATAPIRNAGKAIKSLTRSER